MTTHSGLGASLDSPLTSRSAASPRGSVRLASSLSANRISAGCDMPCLVAMVTFVITVLVAYAYVWRRGGLDWD